MKLICYQTIKIGYLLFNEIFTFILKLIITNKPTLFYFLLIINFTSYWLLIIYSNNHRIFIYKSTKTLSSNYHYFIFGSLKKRNYQL